MSDRDALMYIHENTQMHPLGWNYDTNWNTEKRCNVWYGVRVDEGAHVVSIVLSENRLMGKLLETDRLKQLPNLKSLFLNSNFIKGAIPRCLGDLRGSLTELNLAWNELEGNIPESIFSCRLLKVLRLDNNRLTGGLSEALANLQQLRLLDVSNNLLVGGVPRDGGGDFFPSLGFCSFTPGNNFSGVVPANATAYRDWLMSSPSDSAAASLSSSPRE
jgi:hypothetical protein